MASSSYPTCYAAVRKYEGGNDDDPRDPGGRTSRGIIQREWDKYRLTHPGRPADVWKASEDDIATIYKGDYWDKQWLDFVAAGLDETLFDYGVNSGIGRSAKVLRRCLHMPDNAATDAVRARLNGLAPDQVKILITAVNDERLAFLQSLKTWKTFGGGWGPRVASVKVLSMKLLAAASVPTAAAPSIVPPLIPDAGSDKTNARGQHAEPTVAKNVVKSAPVAGSASGGATLFDWIHAHPVEAGLAVVAMIAAAAVGIYLINRWHKARQEAPVAGWTPPAELKPAS
jgi:lysozyme family protein